MRACSTLLGRHAASTVALASVLILIIVVGAASIFLVESDTAGLQPVRTYTVSQSATSTGVQSPSQGLELSLRLNSSDVSAGGWVGATVDEANTMTTPDNVSASGDWAVRGLAVGPCGPLNYPIGVAVLSGNYDASNASSGQALQIYKPGVYGCPPIFTTKGNYVFQASSDNATVFGSCQTAGGGCTSEEVNSTVSFGGYWSGSAFTSFPSGIYTVVAGDEWGALAVLHFAVTGSS